MFKPLPIETQQIDKYIYDFSREYSKYNNFISLDNIYILSFSLLLLNTDKFNKSNKHKMSKVDFIKNTNYIEIDDLILEYFYDNTCYTPFIKALDLDKLPNSHPYSYILNNNLDRFKLDPINVENNYTLSTIYSHHKLNSLFVNAPIIRLSTNEFLRLTHYSKMNIKLPKNTLWKTYIVILTGSQLLLYKNLNILDNLKTEILKFNNLVKHHLTSNSTHASLNLRNLDTPSQHSFKPDDIIHLDDTIALIDNNYKKHPHTFTLFSRNKKYLIQSHSDENLHLWINLINYSAAFKYSNIRIRGHSLSDSHLYYAGIKAKQRNTHLAPPITQTGSMNSSSTDASSSPSLNRVSDFNNAIDSINSHLNSSVNIQSRSYILKSKINHLKSALDALSTDLNNTINSIRLVSTLTPFRRSTKSKLVNDYLPSLLKKLDTLRIDEFKYISIKSALELDLVVEEKLEARMMKVGLRAAASHSEAMRIRSKSQSMYVQDEQPLSSAERKLTKKTRSAMSLNSSNYINNSLPTTADLSTNNNTTNSIDLQPTQDIGVCTSDIEERRRSRCASETEEYSNRSPNYGHISLVKMPDAIHRHARNWSLGGRTSKEIVSPSNTISLND
ncbi:hypothetical protein E3Q15_02696 [Wallemia mellicola]|nr:hypothetical protein E3Q15_02696 [Wallemia mellicola]TIC53951.1 hypothetical protein E3Q05_02248 [Wallemia mellicola]